MTKSRAEVCCHLIMCKVEMSISGRGIQLQLNGVRMEKNSALTEQIVDSKWQS